CRLALAGGFRLLLRRRLYRRDLGARHAQPDGGLARDLPRCLVRAARLRQLRPVGRTAGALRRAWRAGGARLSAAAEAVIRLTTEWASPRPSASRHRRRRSPTASRGR